MDEDEPTRVIEAEDLRRLLQRDAFLAAAEAHDAEQEEHRG